MPPRGSPEEWTVQQVGAWVTDDLGFPLYSVSDMPGAPRTVVLPRSVAIAHQKCAAATTLFVPFLIKACFTTNYIDGKKLRRIDASKLPRIGIRDFNDMKVWPGLCLFTVQLVVLFSVFLRRHGFVFWPPAHM